MSATTVIPLMPLNTVLFPGGYLPLRIFEQRYIDMVRECSAGNTCFGVCLVNTPQNGSPHATHMNTGTLARIRDWSTLEGGLLGITAQGDQRFVIQKTRIRDNGLLIAEVEMIDEPETVELPDQYSVLSLIAGRFMDKLGVNYPDFESRYLQDAAWVGYRLAELLPWENHEKQVLLQLGDPLERLQKLLELLSGSQDTIQ